MILQLTVYQGVKWRQLDLLHLSSKISQYRNRSCLHVRGVIVSGSSCRLACFRHRWSSVRTVTKTGPELLSGCISGCAGVEKSSPWWIAGSSSPLKLLSSIPRIWPLHHLNSPTVTPSFSVFLSLSLTSTSPCGFPSFLLALLPFLFLQHPQFILIFF